MKRFSWGATNRPSYGRPGAGYGRLVCGAPGPTREVVPSEDIVPEMFTENSPAPLTRTVFTTDYYGGIDTIETTIDLTFE